MFTPVDVKKRGTLVAEQILSAIQQERLRAGDQLPSERELSLQTGVSRPSIREAISAIQLLGIVESCPGRGTFVTTLGRDLAILSSAVAQLYQSGDLSEALEIRRLVETASATLIVQNKTSETTREIQAAFKQFEVAVEQQDFEHYSRANLSFHMALAKATGNSLIQTTLNPLLNLMIGGLAQKLRERAFRVDPDFFSWNLAIHEAILRAYERGDTKNIEDALHNHYDRIRDSL